MGVLYQKYQCPSCNEAVVFKHAFTNFAVCNNCKSVLQNEPKKAVQLTAYASFTNTVSPINIGMKGNWQNKNFEVIGGSRVWMQETVFHYWTIVFSDNTYGWLSEGYGLFAICLETKPNQVIHYGSLNSLKTGDKKNLDIKKSASILLKKSVVSKIEFIGEAWMQNVGTELEIFEFGATFGNRIEFHQSKSQELTAYAVHPTNYQTLGFEPTTTKDLTTVEISCLYCNGKNEIKAWPYTQSFGCLHCETKYEIKQNKEAVVRGTNKKSEQFALSIGSKGVIHGTSYEIIGYAQKEEKNIYKSKWKEYVLWNMEQGFCFLSEFNGHWILVQEKNDTPILERSNIKQFEYDKQFFDIYNRYKYTVIQSKGCFPYNIYNDEEITVEEFIAPPKMWIQERSDKEGITWYYGEHIDKKDIEQAFQVKLSQPTGVGAIQPRGTVNVLSLKIFTAIIIAIALITHLIIGATLNEKVVFEQNYYLNDSTKTVNTVTEKFELTKNKSNLAFDVTAPLDNSWLSVDVQLINIKTGEEFNVSLGLEYYSGYEGGEYWKEGDKTTREYVSSLPKGTYYLKLQSSTDSYKGPNDFTLTVTNDVSMNKNIIIIMLLLLIAPLGYYLYGRYIEYQRWNDSEFSPYNYNA